VGVFQEVVAVAALDFGSVSCHGFP
jgi:hypothetical protein